MKHRLLGKSGLRVSEAALGTMPLVSIIRRDAAETVIRISVTLK
jgi:aryl-alcohol dehydrogenase-like predicted oxidoreductase